MESGISASLLAKLRSETRQIRNLQLVFQDFEPLLEPGKKIPGTTIDAYCASLQAQCEASGSSPSWCMFSSWLAVLVSGKSKNPALGTVEEHIALATTEGTPESILARSRWIVPLSGGRVIHWVLAWVDFGAYEVGIFDSIPELGSSSWAEPLLLKVVDAIREYAGAPKMEWDSGQWKRALHAPDELERQLDSWACGLFLAMAAKSTAHQKAGEKAWAEVKDSHKDGMRKEMLEVLMKLPVVRTTKQVDGEHEEEDDVPIEITAESFVQVHGDPRREGDGQEGDVYVEVRKEDARHVQHGIDSIKSSDVQDAESNSTVYLEDIAVSEPGASTSSGKRPRKDHDPSSDPLEEPPLKKEKVTKGVRAKKKNEEERKKDLLADEWCLDLEEKEIRCRGCNLWIQLQGNRKYDGKNWLVHKSSCPQITGKIHRRRLEPKPKFQPPPPGVSAISSYFTKSTPTAASSTGSTSAVSERPAEHRPKYVTTTYNATPSIAGIFGPRRPGDPLVPKYSKPDPIRSLLLPCKNLRTAEYQEYILRTQTRSLGGVSLELRARAIRQLLPWKPHADLKLTRETKDSGVVVVPVPMSTEIPDGCNNHVKYSKWTAKEKAKLDEVLRAWARWEVDYVNGCVRSTQCHGTTRNAEEICDACVAVSEDPSFQHGVRKKVRESELPQDEQRKVGEQRAKYAPSTMPAFDANKLSAQFKDPLIFDAFMNLERGEDLNCFLKLYKHAESGQLQDKQVFVDLCKVMADQVQRHSSTNPNAKFGIRYPRNFLNFMILVRSYGPNSARQYDLISAELCGPSPRHLRSLVANHEDALKNPYLIFENVARVKRYVDTIKYTGPVAVAGDCTKVRPRLTYSNDFGSHILGSTLPLEECEIDDADDIDDAIQKIREKKAMATQVRAILIKIPLPEHPPMVVSLIPTSGKDDAAGIHELQLKLLKMAANLDLPVVSFAADGAASELAAQVLLDNFNDPTLSPPVKYTNLKYGLCLQAIVFRKTGPVVSLTDGPHAKKTCRNQNDHGTHTPSLGKGFIVYRTTLQVYETGNSGMKKKDAVDKDKQDDGAARRLFLFFVLVAMTEEIPDGAGERRIKEGFLGLFVYLYVFGSLFDAWMSRTMSIRDRILAAFRARFFLHLWRKHIVKLSAQFPDLYSPTRSFISPASFHIFNRLCDTLVTLALIYTHYYPDQPFCPWLHGTEFVEHFFGLARMMLPNFTYAEFYKMVQHIMVRQRILLSGKFNEKRERDSAVGYIMDYDAKGLSAEDQKSAMAKISNQDLDELADLAFREAAVVCKDLLCIPVAYPTEEKPLDLTPLGASTRKANKAPSNEPNSDSESDVEDIDDDVDCDSDTEDVDPNSMGEGLSLSQSAAAATRDVARYSALCQDLDEIAQKLSNADSTTATAEPTIAAGPLLPPPPPPAARPLDIARVAPVSKILDSNGKISISRMIEDRKACQAGTTAHSERVVELNPKFALAQVLRETNEAGDVPKMTIKEAAHRVRIMQDKDGGLIQEPKKTRELRWQESARRVQALVSPIELPNVTTRNVSVLYPIVIGSFLIMRTAKRVYIGEVLDIYKKGSSGRYGSIPMASAISDIQAFSLRVFLPLQFTQTHDLEDDDMIVDDSDTVVPNFSCIASPYKYHLHTYASISTLLYNLDLVALTPVNVAQPYGSLMALSPLAATRWKALTRKDVTKEFPRLKSLKIKLPASGAAQTKAR
ncbi:hypothetical protein DFH06DRAFT_1166490 [Mycena polygramma]|nr:hypothetical protein DFH06DRAFT_1166490 [Mycena polygramma]